jgi:hypothetical protein
MSEPKWEYCPNCASPWNPWAQKDEPSECWACGYKKPVNGELAKNEPIPDHCEAHPHYAAKGVPKEDCLTCWKMYRSAIDTHIKSIGG